MHDDRDLYRTAGEPIRFEASLGRPSRTPAFLIAIAAAFVAAFIVRPWQLAPPSPTAPEGRDQPAPAGVAAATASAMSATTTLAPSATNRFAYAKPIPAAPPVTMITLSGRRVLGMRRMIQYAP